MKALSQTQPITLVSAREQPVVLSLTTLTIMSTSTLSLSNSAWKLNIIMPTSLVLNIVTIATLRKTAFSDTLLSLAPVDTHKIPYLCLFVVVQIWMFTRLVIPFSLSNRATKSVYYENKTPRLQNTVDYLGDILYKLQCAHENTLEAIVMATVAVVTASNLGLDQVVFAKLSIFNLLARMAYPFLSVLGPDMIRSAVFAFGFFSSMWIVMYSLFPELL